MKIIIAENSKQIRNRIIEKVSSLDSTEAIFESMNVPETIDIYSICHPDVVILDYKLIGGNSLDVLETIKHEGRSLLVIVLTDSSNPKIKEQCLNLGAQYVFHKLLDIEKIPGVVSEFQEDRKTVAKEVDMYRNSEILKSNTRG
ncbi:response regulator [candidate division KSB1 bacterium]|nr:response regulator [candidate division KSB1 bacterium]TDI76382.1 MAG: response regulator transcription factor [Bacteroidota bacterium]